MKKLSEQLQQFIDGDLPVVSRRRLTPSEGAILRALKGMGERATKGRDISKCVYETKFRDGRVIFVMLLEGRQAMAVGNHVSKRFDGHDELEFAGVHETKRGAKVVLRPREEIGK
jgi:hypothetical protein